MKFNFFIKIFYVKTFPIRTNILMQSSPAPFYHQKSHFNVRTFEEYIIPNWTMLFSRLFLVRVSANVGGSTVSIEPSIIISLQWFIRNPVLQPEIKRRQDLKFRSDSVVKWKNMGEKLESFCYYIEGIFLVSTQEKLRVVLCI